MDWLKRLADYDSRMQEAGGAGEAFNAIDALRTGKGAHPALAGLERGDLSRFDRYAQGAAMAEDDPVATVAAVPFVAAYEGLKLAPSVLNAMARIPGWSQLKVDETTSPPSVGNVLSMYAGMARPLGQRAQSVAGLRALGEALASWGGR